MKHILLAGVTLLVTSLAWAHEPIHRIALMPLEAPSGFKAAADESWWSVRQQLTATGRFLVATKRVMLTKDVFVPKFQLRATDAIALSQALNADAIATGAVQDQHVVLSLYGRERGSLLWKKEAAFSSAEPRAGQVEGLFRQLTDQLLLEIPYQGHLTNRRAEVKGLSPGQMLHFTLGTGAHYSEGDEVILGDMVEVSPQPLFMGGGQIQPVAFGEIVSWNPPIAEVRVVTLVQGKKLIGPPLVAVPSGMERLKAELGVSDEMKVPLSSDLSNAAQKQRQEEKEETHRLLAVLSWVGSLVAMLVLAF